MSVIINLQSCVRTPLHSSHHHLKTKFRHHHHPGFPQHSHRTLQHILQLEVKLLVCSLVDKVIKELRRRNETVLFVGIRKSKITNTCPPMKVRSFSLKVKMELAGAGLKDKFVYEVELEECIQKAHKAAAINSMLHLGALGDNYNI